MPKSSTGKTGKAGAKQKSASKKQADGSPVRWRTNQLPWLPLRLLRKKSLFQFSKHFSYFKVEDVVADPQLCAWGHHGDAERKFWQVKGLDAVCKCAQRLKEPVEVIFGDMHLFLDKVTTEEPQTALIGPPPVDDEVILATALKNLGFHELAELVERSRGLTRHLFFMCYRRDFLLPLIRQTLMAGTSRQTKLNLLLDAFVGVLDSGDHLDFPKVWISKDLSCFFTSAVLKQLGEEELLAVLETPQAQGSFDDIINLRVPIARQMLSGNWHTAPKPIPAPEDFKRVEFSGDFKQVYFDGILGIEFKRMGNIPLLLQHLYNRYEIFKKPQSRLRANGERPTAIRAVDILKIKDGRRWYQIIQDRPESEKMMLNKIVHVELSSKEDEELTLSTNYAYTLKSN